MKKVINALLLIVFLIVYWLGGGKWLVGIGGIMLAVFILYIAIKMQVTFVTHTADNHESPLLQNEDKNEKIVRIFRSMIS